MSQEEKASSPMQYSRVNTQSQHAPQNTQRHFLADLLFVLCAALIAWTSLQGCVELSSSGAMFDSDLGTYAQGMAAREHPEYFVNDEVLKNVTHHNSIWNLQTKLGELLTPGDAYAVGLMRSGSLCIFLYYIAWYAFGRALFGRPAFALLLVLVQSITCWVGWGTFWGITLENPIPRVWFSALYPFLLWGCMKALAKPNLQPLVMLACGLSVWVHSISALTVGAMTFLAFFLFKPEKISLLTHCARSLAGLVLFFIPVLAFLWPTLSEEHVLSSADLEILTSVFSIRYAKDYGAPLQQLINYVTNYTLKMPLFPAALVALWLVRKKGSAQLGTLVRLYAPFVLAIILVVLFSFAEGYWARQQGHMPLGHELVRGARFLIPLAWIVLVAGVYCVVGTRKLPVRCLACCILAALLVFSADKQLIFALHTLHLDSISIHKQEIDSYAHEAQQKTEAFAALKKYTNVGDVVFCNQPEAGIRHLALRGIAYSFKDGANAFYDRDVDRGRKWLKYTGMMHQSTTSYIDAWLYSGVQWLLSDRVQDSSLLEKYGTIVWKNQSWLLVRKGQEREQDLR